MTVTVTIPDEVAASSRVGDLPRMLLEAFAVQGYRDGRLSLKEVRLLLGLDTRWDAEDFLSAHGAWPAPTEEEVVAGAKAIREALERSRLP